MRKRNKHWKPCFPAFKLLPPPGALWMETCVLSCVPSPPPRHRHTLSALLYQEGPILYICLPAALGSSGLGYCVIPGVSSPGVAPALGPPPIDQRRGGCEVSLGSWRGPGCRESRPATRYSRLYTVDQHLGVRRAGTLLGAFSSGLQLRTTGSSPELVSLWVK